MHQYDSVGSYSVSLKVIAHNGSADVEEKSGHIRRHPIIWGKTIDY